MDVIFGGIIFVLALVGFVVFVNSMKGIFQMLFKKKTEDKVMEAVNKVNESVQAEEVKPEPIDEWIWVEGYKATEKDMTCRGYQYELGTQHDMPEGAEITECESGFHFCKELKHVFKYYIVANNNRFFEVKALVRKSDYEKYGESHMYFEQGYGLKFTEDRTKLVAKSIIFTRELTVDEIVAHYSVDDWSEEDKKRIVELGIDEARRYVQIRDLTGFGYSETFARMIVEYSKYDIAKAVGSQPDLSMDMKCWLIFK